MGTSITQAVTGYSQQVEEALRTANPGYFWEYPESAYSGSSTWVRLWYMQTDLIDEQPDCVIYECVSEYPATPDQYKAAEEGAIRRVRGGVPGARIVVVGMPLFVDNETPGEINTVQLEHLQDLCTKYNMTYVDWPARVQGLIDAEVYSLPDLYVDTVHPTSTGHTEIKNLLMETLSKPFVISEDTGWTGNINDYAMEWDDGTFSDTANYIARNGTDNDGETGTGWSTSGTARLSSTADDTIQWTGVFESYGVDIDASDACSFSYSIDGGGFTSSNIKAGDRQVNMLGGYVERDEHTVTLKVVSGTVKINRFLAI